MKKVEIKYILKFLDQIFLLNIATNVTEKKFTKKIKRNTFTKLPLSKQLM